MKKSLIIILCCLLVLMCLMGLSVWFGYLRGVAVHEQEVVRDTVTLVDTIVYHQPVPKDSTIVRYVTRVLPTSGPDSVPCPSRPDTTCSAVVVPIRQKCYEGDDYRAYVSGYEPSLDSLFVYPKTTLVREYVPQPEKRWCVGVTGGYGYGLRSGVLEPYIGVGISYTLFRF